MSESQMEQTMTAPTEQDRRISCEKLQKTLKSFYGVSCRVLSRLENLSREDWLGIRKLGVGGSEIGAILGHSKYKCALDVYLDKTNQTEKLEEVSEEQQAIMDSGSDMEELILDLYAKKTGRKVVRVRGVLQHLTEDHVLANIDAIAQHEDGSYGILEIKNTLAWGEDWKEGVPKSYEDQCRQGMLVTGLQWGEVVSLRAGRWTEQSRFPVTRGVEWDAKAVMAIRDFWVCVEEMSPPRLQDTEGPEDRAIWREALIRSLDAGTAAKSVTAGPREEELIARAKVLSASVKEQEAELEACKALLADHLSGPGTISSSAGTVTFTQNKASSKFDRKGFAAAHPELEKQFSTTAPGAFVMRFK